MKSGSLLTAFCLVGEGPCHSSSAPCLPTTSNNLQKPTKANSTICTSLYWSAFVSLLLLFSKRQDVGSADTPYTDCSPRVAVQINVQASSNRWIADGCIGAMRYFSQTTDSGVLFPASAAVSVKDSDILSDIAKHCESYSRGLIQTFFH